MGVDRDERRFHRSQRADHLADEVGIARAVDDVDSLARVIEMDDARFDRVLVMLLFFVEIANAGAGVDTGFPIHGSAVHQQLIDQSRLAGVAVSTNCKVPNIRDIPDHDCSL